MTMEENFELIEKKRIMSKTDNSGFMLIMILVICNSISYDTSDIRSMIVHLIFTFIALYMIYKTVLLNIEFTNFLSEEKVEIKWWEGNLLLNMISLLIAVSISFFLLNNNLPHTYTVDLLIIIPGIILYPIFRTYKKVSRINLYKNI